MDFAAIRSSPDSVLHGLGLTAKGDIYSLRGLVAGDQKEKSDDRGERMKTLLEKLTGKRPSKKPESGQPSKRVKSDETGPSPMAEKQKTRKVSLGWQHYSLDKRSFVPVRLAKGGGTREVDLPADASKEDVIDVAKVLFFRGKSSFGKAEHMNFSLGNF